MAALKQSNQVCSSSLSDENHSRSKAQMYLKKILDFISSTNISLENMQFVESELKVKKQEETEVVLSCGKQGFDIDLNLRLGLCLESENKNKGLSACSGVGEDDDGCVCGITINCSSRVCFGDVDKSCEDHVCDSSVVVEEETRELSDITNLQVTSSEIETCEHGQQSEKRKRQLEEEVGVEVEVEQQSKLLRTMERKNEGYLDLLVEAARLISGNFEDDDGHRISKKTTRSEDQSKEETQSIAVESKEKWVLDCYGGGFQDISPIVRSKRGRNQVLPYRFRDSVLEPWKTLNNTKRRSSRVSAAKQRTR